MTLDRVQGHLLLGICPSPARPADRPRLRRAARLVRLAAGDPAQAMAGGWSSFSPRRPPGRDRLVDGRLRPGRPPRRQPHPPRDPSARRLAHLRGDHLGRSRPSRPRRGERRSGRAPGADADHRDLDPVRSWRSRSCSAPMSPGSTPAMRSAAGRTWAANGSRPGRRCWSRSFATSSTIRSSSSSSTAGWPGSSHSLPGRSLWPHGGAAWPLHAGLVAGLVLLQILLGILTLLSGVELWIAVSHQAMAALASRRDHRHGPSPRKERGMSDRLPVLRRSM